MIKAYLASDFHKFGCIFAIIGCIATLIGIFSFHWFWLVLSSYILGVVFLIVVGLITAYLQHKQQQSNPSITQSSMNTPRIERDFALNPPHAEKHQQILFEFEKLQQTTQTQLSPKANQVMSEIHQVMQFMTDKINSSQNLSFKYEVENIQRTMNAYLSPTLQYFCNLPYFLRERRVINQNYTPYQLLEQQLQMILNELKNIAEDIYLNDLNALIDHNKYLEYKLQQHEFFKINS